MAMTSLDDVFELHIESWNRYVYLPVTSHKTAAPKERPTLSLALPPLFGVDATKAAQIVAHNVLYHWRLGVGKAYVYVTHATVAAYLANSDLAGLVAKRRVVLLLFDAIPACQLQAPCIFTHCLGPVGHRGACAHFGCR